MGSDCKYSLGLLRTRNIPKYEEINRIAANGSVESEVFSIDHT